MDFRRLNTRLALLFLQGSRERMSQKYWRNIIGDTHMATIINQDLPYVKEQEISQVSFTLSEEDLEEVLKLTGEETEKLRVIYITIFTLLLHKFTNETLISFGIENEQGDVSLLKIELEECFTIRDILNKVKNQWIALQEHKKYPLEIFEIENNYKLYHILFSLNTNKINARRKNFSVDLREENKELKGIVTFDKKAYSPRKIGSFINYFQHFLKLITRNINAKLRDIEVILPEEKEKLFKVFNNTYVPINRGKLFIDTFQEKVSEYPSNVVAKDIKREITYKDLDLESNKVANFLLDNGLQKGDCIAIVKERSIDFLIVLLGVLKSGGVFIALDIDTPVSRLSLIIKDSEATAIFLDDSLLEKKDFLKLISKETKIDKVITENKTIHNLKEVDNPFKIFVSNKELENYKSNPIKIKLCADDLCYYIFSSGTTGKPKGIMLHHLGMINHFIGLADVLEMNEKDCLAQTALCSFDIFVVQTLLPLIKGAKVLFVPKETLLQPSAFFTTLSKESVSIIELVPSLIKTLLAELNYKEAEKLTTLKKLISCGEQLTAELAMKWFSNFPDVPIINAYGPAEASDDVTAHVIDKNFNKEKKIIPIGKPLDNVHMYVLDKYGQLTPIGVQGEICISGISVGKGYLNEPEKTRKVFVPNQFQEAIKDKKEDHDVIYKTGDLGYWNSEGHITFKGRKDFMVKIRGVRIELAEIEVVISKNEAVNDVFVTDFKHNEEKVLCAYYSTLKPLSKKELDSFLREKLPVTMIPSFFVELEEIPYTKNGKIDRKKLPSPIINNNIIPIDEDDEIQIGLQEIWIKNLQIEASEIGLESDFFHLGGHSLLAIRLTAAIKRTFNLEIKLDEVFEYSGFQNLVQVIKSSKAKKEELIPVIRTKEHYVTSPPQRRFYIHNQIYPEDLSYNSPQYYKVKGDLDVVRVKEAFNELIQKHETLRTSFKIENNIPVQVIQKNVPFEIEYTIEKEENISSKIKNFVKPFNLNKAPLFRVSLIKCSEEEHYLLFDSHHIICDQVSDLIIVEDFIKAYSGKKLEHPKITYKDYSEWFNAKITEDKYKSHENYWLNSFKTIPPKLSLPYDKSEVSKREKFGQDIILKLTKEETEIIRGLQREHKVTAFMFFLSVFNVQLKRISFSNEISVGTPVSGRDHQDLQGIVGLFLNLIVIKNKLSENVSFINFLKEVKQNCINALKYQTYPFDLLISKLGVQSKSNETPLYNVMFAHLIKGREEVVTNEIVIKALDVAHNTAKADLQLTVYEGNENFELFLTINTNLFSKDMGELIMKNFKSTLNKCVKNPNLLIEEIPLPTEFDFLNKETNLIRNELTF